MRPDEAFHCVSAITQEGRAAFVVEVEISGRHQGIKAPTVPPVSKNIQLCSPS